MELSFTPVIRCMTLMVTALAATISIGLGSEGLRFPTYALGKNGFVFENLPEISRWDAQRLTIAVKLDEEIDVIHAINSVLKKRNIKLLVTLVPMVHTIYNAQLPESFVRPQFQRELYSIMHKRLNQLGIDTPNLEQAFLKHPSRKTLIDPLFMRADHHWSPPGGLEAARVIGNHIQTKYPAMLADIPEVKYSMRLKEPQMFWEYASLFKKLPPSEQAKVKRDAIRVPEFSVVPSASGTEDSGLGLGLLTDTTPRLAVVGTSFSDIEAFGFVGGLAHHLSRDVLNAAHGGIGGYVPMAEYLASDTFQDHPPAMIVWELPELLLVFGMKPISNGDDWSARQYMLEIGANLLGACQNGVTGRITTTNGFTIQNPNASVTSSTGASFVQYQFPNPIKSDQYLSLKASSSTSDSFLIEGEGSKPARYFVKLGEYNATHRVNVPLATLVNGKTRNLKIRIAPGSQLRLEEPVLCNAAPELMRLASNRQ
jgi:SGNH hydrolase-like domain, acetyltransferase AlgX